MDRLVGNSCSIFLMGYPFLCGVSVVLSGDVVNKIVCITEMIFVKGFKMDYCYGLEYITNGLN